MQYEPQLHKLSNGVTVILDPMDLASACVKVYFKTGNRDEAPHELGLTHFCEHMLFRGSPRFPTSRSRREYVEYNGGTINAATGWNRIFFYGRIVAENVHVLFDVIGDMLQNSLFDSDALEIEQRVVADELRRDLDSERVQLIDFTADKLFAGRVASSRQLGTFETIASFNRDMVVEFIGRRLSASNCIICVSGKINNASDLLAHLERTFAFLPTHDVPENTDIEYTPAIAHNSRPGKQNVHLRILFPDIWPISKKNRYKNMCVSKFETFMTREISDVLRQENGLVYGFSGDSAGTRRCGLSGFATQTSAENIARVVELVAQNAYKIYMHNPITHDALDRYARRGRLHDADWLESATTRCDKLIAHYRGYGTLYDFYNVIKMSDSATVDDVIKYSRGYFDGPMSIITQGADYNADLKKIWDENFCEK